VQVSESLQKRLIIIPVLAGIAVLVGLILFRPELERVPAAEQAPVVRIIRVPQMTVIPRVQGYGLVAPETVWEAVAQVSGEIVEIHPQLKKGSIVTEGSVLLRIDPTDYALAVAQAEANLRAVEAQIKELELREANTRASLGIEKEVLELGESELRRKRRLLERGTITPSVFEQEQRAVLGQRQNVQSLQNTLNLIPAERARLEAEYVVSQSQLKSAQLNQERTVFRAPFTGRVAQVNMEKSQFVRQGEVLAVVDGIAVAEITAHIPLDKMRSLIIPDERLSLAELDPGLIREILDIAAQVRLRTQDFEVNWKARFARLSDIIEPETRTVGVIVTVAEPYRQAQPGIRPPLIKGMFVEVILHGKPRPESQVIPRAALHNNNEVYVVDDHDRLAKRTVTVGLRQPGFVTITAGLKSRERVVITDLMPAVEGMLLKPKMDKSAQIALLREARGEEIR
jgi:membrane fusion protein, multidrug efflux system